MPFVVYSETKKVFFHKVKYRSTKKLRSRIYVTSPQATDAAEFDYARAYRLVVKMNAAFKGDDWKVRDLDDFAIECFRVRSNFAPHAELPCEVVRTRELEGYINEHNRIFRTEQEGWEHLLKRRRIDLSNWRKNILKARAEMALIRKKLRVKELPCTKNTL